MKTEGTYTVTVRDIYGCGLFMLKDQLQISHPALEIDDFRPVRIGDDYLTQNGDVRSSGSLLTDVRIILKKRARRRVTFIERVPQPATVSIGDYFEVVMPHVTVQGQRHMIQSACALPFGRESGGTTRIVYDRFEDNEG